MNYLLILLSSFFTIQEQQAQVQEELSLEKMYKQYQQIKKEMLIKSVLDSIPNRETRFDKIGDKAYTLVSHTLDYGKYQINWIHFQDRSSPLYPILKNVTKQEYLNNPELQNKCGRILMEFNYNYLCRYGDPDEKALHLSWFGIVYAINYMKTWTY